MAKVTDLTKNHTGKWFEVVRFDVLYDENPVIVAKTLDKLGAQKYANWYNTVYTGFVEIVVR